MTFERYHFGLIYQTYNFYQPVYIYKIPEGGTSYQYDSQAIGDVKTQNILFHGGRSMLDYLIKYETGVNTFFIDWEGRIGTSINKFSGDFTSTGSRKPTSVNALAYGVQLEGGFLWYKRWETLAGLGGAIKISYRVDYTNIGSNTYKPEDRDEAVEEDTYYETFSRVEKKHGPVIFASLNF